MLTFLHFPRLLPFAIGSGNSLLVQGGSACEKRAPRRAPVPRDALGRRGLHMDAMAASPASAGAPAPASPGVTVSDGRSAEPKPHKLQPSAAAPPMAASPASPAPASPGVTVSDGRSAEPTPHKLQPSAAAPPITGASLCTSAEQTPHKLQPSAAAPPITGASLEAAWRAQLQLYQEANAADNLKLKGKRPDHLRLHIERGLAPVQVLLGQQNTQHHVRIGRQDTEGGKVGAHGQAPGADMHVLVVPMHIQICSILHAHVHPVPMMPPIHARRAHCHAHVNASARLFQTLRSCNVPCPSSDPVLPCGCTFIARLPVFQPEI